MAVGERVKHQSGLDARLKCRAVGGGAGWVPTAPEKSGQGGGGMASAAISFFSAGSPCWVSLCCRLARGRGRDDRKCDGPTTDSGPTGGRNAGIVARSNQPNTGTPLPAGRESSSIPFSLPSPSSLVPSFTSNPAQHRRQGPCSQSRNLLPPHRRPGPDLISTKVDRLTEASPRVKMDWGCVTPPPSAAACFCRPGLVELGFFKL